MGIRVTIENFEITQGTSVENDENIAILTEFTIKECAKVTEDVEGKNEFLSKNINGIKVKGKYSIANNDQETTDIEEIFEWYKKTAHEKQTYRKVKVEFTDVNDNVYDEFEFEKAFIVDYHKKHSHKMGTIEYEIFLRKFDDAEPAIKF